MQKEYERYAKMIGPMKFSKLGIVFLSICAGVGEEIFFRAFLQPMTGIWLASLIFVAIHGYLNPRRPIAFYGLFLVVAIAGMGWMFENFGFWSAASAHFMVDLILLSDMKNDFNEELPD